ncbi:hypothetical protein HS088_TW13G01570 [Tripterygium wilfordii]|uniref:Uncharacterized protein n=1 Tax=Tripterygium wilfordii TaxID=458696 RepID=A0A7J7CXK2_TRIWF|nr:hypothetical protein HS088_TW13G01570 [Tripterygium wilfordii]
MERQINSTTRVLDISSFLLVEGSADSEMDDGYLDTFIAGDDDDDDDDAESCSCDSPVLDFSDDDRHMNVHGDYHCWNNCNMWWSDLGIEGMAPEEGEEEEEVSLDLHKTRQAKDEMEDKLFWETCMELGYP